MKTKLSIFSIFIVTIIFSQQYSLSAQSILQEKIEIGIYDPEISKFDLNKTDYKNIKSLIELKDFSQYIFKIFTYENENGNEDKLILIKRSKQEEIWELTGKNINKVIVFYIGEKLYSYALIQDNVSSPIIISKLIK